jgi:hypothetical protein
MVSRLVRVSVDAACTRLGRESTPACRNGTPHWDYFTEAGSRSGNNDWPRFVTSSAPTGAPWSTVR